MNKFARCRWLPAVACCLWALARPASASVPAAGDGVGDVAPPIVDRRWDQAFGFPVGEELTYTLYWGIIPVGHAHVTTSWVDDEAGRRLLHIRGRTLSNKVIGKLYPVNDVVESFVEPDSFLPVRFARNLSEGRTRRHDETVFDFSTLKATYRSFIKDKVREFPIEPDSRDILTFMYYTRRQTFQEETAPKFKVMADDKLYDLTTAAQKTETVRLERYGDIPCLKMEPKAAFEGLFVRKGRMFTWVSTDSRHLLVKAWVDTPFANVKILLEKVHGPGSDFWVRPKDAAAGR